MSSVEKPEKPAAKTERGNTFNTYTYRDNSAGRKVVFECVAKNIFEADALYRKATGADPRKQMYIGLSWEPVEDDTKGRE